MDKGEKKSLSESCATPRPSRDYEVALSNGSKTHIRANHVFVFEGAATFTDEGGFVAAFGPGFWRHIRHVAEKQLSDDERDIAYFEEKLSDAFKHGDVGAAARIHMQLSLLKDTMIKYKKRRRDGPY